MRHLTSLEVMLFVDATTDYSTMAFCTNHLAVCERCRKKVEVQKWLAKSVRQVPLDQTRARFSDSVMKLVMPSARSSWSAKILNNLGPAFGLMMVVSAGVLLYDAASKFQFSQGTPSQVQFHLFNEIAKEISTKGEGIARMLPLGSVGNLVAAINTPILWSSVMLLLLLLGDQLFSKKAIRNIRKLKTQ